VTVVAVIDSSRGQNDKADKAVEGRKKPEKLGACEG